MTAPAKLPLASSLGSSMGEFALIENYFKAGASAMLPVANPNAKEHLSVALGIGDDCALIKISQDELLAISTDMLVEGRHFLPGANPHWLGHKACLLYTSPSPRD